MKFLIELTVIDEATEEPITDAELIRQHIEKYSFAEDVIIELTVPGKEEWDETYRTITYENAKVTVVPDE